MKKCVKWGIFSFLCVVLATGLTSCNGDDLNYDDVEAPSVAGKNNVSGRVTGIDGKAIAATVTMGTERYETKQDGTFLFENVKVGTYTLKVEATGKLTKEVEVKVEKSNNPQEGSNVVCNVVLSNVGKSIEVKTDGSIEGSVTSETIENNENAKIEVTVTAPENAVPAGKTIIVTPIYTTEEAISLTKAGEHLMLVGTNLSCPGVERLDQSITLAYDIDPEVAPNVTAYKLVNGQWVNIRCSENNGQVTITADEFTSYSLLFDATVTTTTTSEPLAFERNLWDNLYGSDRVKIGEVAYTYKIGTDVEVESPSRVEAYLIEILARIAGASSTTATGTYPINVTLPIGAALQISGQQTVKTLTVSALRRSVTGKQYGGVSVKVATWNRNHTGSSN